MLPLHSLSLSLALSTHLYDILRLFTYIFLFRFRVDAFVGCSVVYGCVSQRNMIIPLMKYLLIKKKKNNNFNLYCIFKAQGHFKTDKAIR